MKQRTIDASGKRIGHIATLAASYLLNKDTSQFERQTKDFGMVLIQNASKLDIPDRKKEGKVYTRYTGFPGGLREMTRRQVIDKKGHADVLRRAVYGMLPSNKLRPRLMKHLVIEE